MRLHLQCGGGDSCADRRAKRHPLLSPPRQNRSTQPANANTTETQMHSTMAQQGDQSEFLRAVQGGEYDLAQDIVATSETAGEKGDQQGS